MAKAKRKRSKKRGGMSRRGTMGRRLGSTIRVRRTRGLGQLSNPSSAMGSIGAPLIGAFAAGATTVGLRMMTPRTEGQMRAIEWAPWIGGLVGTISSLVVGMIAGRPAGWGATAGSSAVTLVLAASEAAARARMEPVQAQAGLGRGRLGAIVMEPHASRGYGAGRLGAIVPEYGSTPGQTRGLGRLGAYGDQVTLRGKGQIRGVNARAFGTPGFAQG